jgi:tetratricopeptide (TPR) repeat protein
MLRHILFILLACSFSYAQFTGPAGPSGGGAAPAGSAPDVGDTQGTMHVKTVSGSVRMENGQAPPNRVGIDRNCGGTRTRATVTDAKGNFSFPLGATKTKPTAVNTDTDPHKTLKDNLEIDCTLQADLPGFESSVLSLTKRLTESSANVGTIVLKRASGVRGTAISAKDAQAPKDARKEYDKGSEALNKGQAEEARKHLEKALAAYPDYPGALVLLGHAQISLNQVEEGVKSYQTAAEKDDAYVLPHVYLAQVAATQQKWDVAITEGNKAIDLDNMNFPAAYFYVAGALYNSHKPEDALKLALRGAEVDKAHTTPRLELLAGQILSLKGEIKEAADHYRNYLQYAPNAPDIGQVKQQLAQLEQMK